MEILRLFLIPFSYLYRLAIAVRNMFFDKGVLNIENVPVPVISVGNISAGGTGKTPVIEMLIEKMEEDLKLAVVSRGYKRRTSGTIIVNDGNSRLVSAEDSGDEPAQVAGKFPATIVIADKCRVRGARKAVELGADLVLLDDGFQHRYLKRDLDIVVVTVQEVVNDGWLLPAGNGREPLRSLERSGLIIVSRCADISEFDLASSMLKKFKKPMIGMRTKLKHLKYAFSNQVLEAAAVEGRRIIAFSGIGSPRSFSDLLAGLKADIAEYFIFPDHHWYSDEDMRKISNSRKECNADYIITTEKDAVRLKDANKEFLKSESVVIAGIGQEIISGEAKFYEILGRFRK